MAEADDTRRERLTKTVVEAIEPPETGYIIVWDVPRAGERRGVGVRVNSGGARTYFAQGRLPGGREVKPTIGRHGKPWTTDQARAKGQSLLGAIVAGIDPTEEKRAARKAERQRRDGADDRSVETVATRWFNDLRRHGKRSADEVERSFKRHVYPELGTRRIETIAKADAHALYERLADNGHAPMGHQLVRNLKALLSFSVERELTEANPLLRIKLPPLESRDRVVIKFHPEQEPDPTELLAVLRAADQLSEPRRTFIHVLVLTLAREDEVGDMPYTELDGGVWRLPAARHKGKRGYDIPLPMQALEMIEALPREREIAGRMVPNEYVFTGRRGGRPIGDFSGIKAELDRLSGVANWRLHDFRRSGSSWIEEEFGSEVMHGCLGHSLGKRLTKTYARGPGGYRRKKRALQAWADFVAGALSPRVGDAK